MALSATINGCGFGIPIVRDLSSFDVFEIREFFVPRFGDECPGGITTIDRLGDTYSITFQALCKTAFPAYDCPDDPDHESTLGFCLEYSIPLSRDLTGEETAEVVAVFSRVRIWRRFPCGLGVLYGGPVRQLRWDDFEASDNPCHVVSIDSDDLTEIVALVESLTEE